MGREDNRVRGDAGDPVCMGNGYTGVRPHPARGMLQTPRPCLQQADAGLTDEVAWTPLPPGPQDLLRTLSGLWAV